MQNKSEPPAEVDRLWLRSRVALPLRYRDCLWTTFKDRPGNQEGRRAAEAWQSSSGNGNMFFHGDAGTGKTYLACTVANELLKPTLFVRTPEMFLKFQASVKEHDEMELLRQYSDSPVIIFDDIGAHRTSDFVVEMFGIMLERFYTECRTGLIFTSNISPQQIFKTMGERVASRLQGLARPVKVEGSDMRI